MSGRKAKDGNRSWRELSYREPVRQRQEWDGNCPAGSR